MKNLVCASLCFAVLLTATQDAEAFGRKKKNTEEASHQQTQEFVDARMHETMSSIDRSLSTLVTITRGGEAGRKPAPIGHTVAGSAGAPRAAEQPPAPPSPPVSDPLSQSVHIVWDGPVEGLLSNIAHQLGYTFKSGAGAFNTHIRLEAEGLTLRQTLEEVARQLGSRGDIHFSSARRTIELTRP